MPKLLQGWRYAAFITGFVGLIGATLYPITVSPMMNSQKYKDIQKEARKGIRQEDIQPGNMNVWEDPFKERANKSQ